VLTPCTILSSVRSAQIGVPRRPAVGPRGTSSSLRVAAPQRSAPSLRTPHANPELASSGVEGALRGGELANRTPVPQHAIASSCRIAHVKPEPPLTFL
jgi:hypothetical protein